MGQKNHGQSRGKKAKGSLKGSPYSQKQLNQSVLVPSLEPGRRARSLQSSFVRGKEQDEPGFSMRDEARHTDGARKAWGETNFRHNGISFVSAGNLKREEDAWNTVSEDDSPHKQSEAEQEQKTQPNSQSILDMQPSVEDATPESKDESLQPAQYEEIGPTEQSILQPSIAPASQIDPSAPPEGESSDSDEEIVFTGRQRTPGPHRGASASQSAVLSATVPVEAAQKPATVVVPAAMSLVPSTHAVDTPSKTVLAAQFATAAIGLESPADETNLGRARKKTKNPLFRKHNDEEALMQDYIDNMALDDSDDDVGDDAEADTGQAGRRKPFKKTEHFRMFGGSGLENEKVQTRSNKSARQTVAQAIDWDSDDLADFDNLSTSDEGVADVGQVIRHRERESGPQYLVVAQDMDANEAKWILQSKLTSKSAITEIQVYHEILLMNIEEDLSDEDDIDDDSEEEALQDLIDTIDSEDDENARILNYTARMTDEQIARALAKQEELGYGGDDIMLFDGDAAAGMMDDDGSDDVQADNGFIPFSLQHHTSNRGRSKRNKKQRDSFPSAEAFADALDQDPYGAYDIMDFERPSLRPKKGRKPDMPWDLDGLDEELKENIMNTWTKDREKKAARKREKEEARLLMSLDAEEAGDPAIVKARIRSFLIQEVDTLKLTPMTSDMRRAVHRLAKALKMNSRSEGKDGVGLGRFPVLTKTPKTPYFTIDTIHQVDALLNTRKFFPKALYKSSRAPQTGRGMRSRQGGGGLMSGATYRDGDEVAASAPELGSDNRGRAMLEKMGWSPGVGIGKVGNKGSLDPIKHIVKTTKAGLG